MCMRLGGRCTKGFRPLDADGAGPAGRAPPRAHDEAWSRDGLVPYTRPMISFFLSLGCAFALAVTALNAQAAERPSTNRDVNENKATAADRIKVPKGFNVELLYSVPGGSQGSWVALCTDPKRRII